MGGGREERKAKSVGGGEEALSYPGGSVSQCSYILGGWFSAAQEVGNAYFWALTLGGKEPCLERCNCKKSPPANENKKKVSRANTRCCRCLRLISSMKTTHRLTGALLPRKTRLPLNDRLDRENRKEKKACTTGREAESCQSGGGGGQRVAPWVFLFFSAPQKSPHPSLPPVTSQISQPCQLNPFFSSENSISFSSRSNKLLRGRRKWLYKALVQK